MQSFSLSLLYCTRCPQSVSFVFVHFCPTALFSTVCGAKYTTWEKNCVLELSAVNINILAVFCILESVVYNTKPSEDITVNA